MFVCVWRCFFLLSLWMHQSAMFRVGIFVSPSLPSLQPGTFLKFLTLSWSIHYVSFNGNWCALTTMGSALIMPLNERQYKGSKAKKTEKERQFPIYALKYHFEPKLKFDHITERVTCILYNRGRHWSFEEMWLHPFNGSRSSSNV